MRRTEDRHGRRLWLFGQDLGALPAVARSALAASMPDATARSISAQANGRRT